MPGDVSVYVRIRPPLAGEPREAAATVLNKETVRLEVARTATVCEHGCDAAFGPQASQAELFDGVARDVVDAVLAGVDGTVVAYGQTGAGKSHTLGVLEAPDHVERARDGVVPRALRRLFAARPGEVVMSFLEIYDDRVRDLLAPPRNVEEVARRRARVAAVAAETGTPEELVRYGAFLASSRAHELRLDDVGGDAAGRAVDGDDDVSGCDTGDTSTSGEKTRF